MKTLKLLQVLLFIVSSLLLHAQTSSQPGEKVIFPSPQAAQLGKYGGYNLNHSSGTANINIPIYTATEGSLSVPVSLAYNYQGWRPSEEPGWVGVGFSLVAGGTITRTIKSTADEIVPGQMAKVKTFVDNVANGNAPDYQQYLELGLWGEGNNYPESQPDIFSFQFDGISGKFVLDETGEAKIISNQIMKITYEKSAVGPENKQVITKWTIIGENGTEYVFAAYEVSYQNENAMYYFPNSWYLTSMTSIKGDRVTFTYSNRDPTKLRVQSGIVDQWGTDNSYTVISRNYSQEVYLESIKGSLWEIKFTSSEVLPGTSQTYSTLGRKLDNIQVKRNESNSTQTVLKQFNFVYKDITTIKLTLESMTEVGVKPYTFSYYSSIPRDVHGDIRQVDAWGYYNGIANPSLVPIGVSGVDLNPRLNQTKTGALTSITYPTGGSTSIEYEQNEYSYVRQSPTTKAKTIVTSSDYYWRVISSLNIRQNNPTKDIHITQPTRVDIRLTSSSCSSSTTPALGTFQTLTLQPGYYSADSLFRLQMFSPCNQVFGNCSPEQMPCPFIAPDGFEASMTVLKYETSDVGKPYYGGMRVSKMTDSPGPGSPDIVTTYSYENEINSPLSSGVIIQEPIYDITYIPSSGIHRVVRSNPFNPVSMNPLYYKRVVESNGLFKTTHTFTSHMHQDDKTGLFAVIYDYGGPRPSFFNSTNNFDLGDYQLYDFMRGLPDETTSADVNGVLKQKKKYLYSGYGFNSEPFKVASFYHESLFTFQVSGGDPIFTYSRNVFYGKGYYIVGGWPRKIQEITTNYGSNGAGLVVTIEDFEYGNPNHRQLTKKRTTESDGSVEEENYSYPLDFSSTSNPVIQSMITANMVTNPLQQVTWTEKSPTDRKVIDASVTMYQSFTGNSRKANLLLPSKKFKFNGLNNSVSTFTPYAGTTAEPSLPSFRETLQYTKYDSIGNPISLLINKADKISYLWAYKGQYPIAEIQNADYTQVAAALGGLDFNQMAALTDTPTIKSKLDALRSALTGSLVTGYLYQPLAGVSSVIRPNGLITSYSYDALQRLEKIKNSNDEVIKSFRYNYKTP